MRRSHVYKEARARQDAVAAREADPRPRGVGELTTHLGATLGQLEAAVAAATTAAVDVPVDVCWDTCPPSADVHGLSADLHSEAPEESADTVPASLPACAELALARTFSVSDTLSGVF